MDEAFRRDLWRFKRREIIAEPQAEDYGLTPELAEGIARRVQKEFEEGQVKRLKKC